MNRAEPSERQSDINSLSRDGISTFSRWRAGNLSSRAQKAGLVVFIILLVGIFIRPLLSLGVYAAGSELSSYVLLVPFVSAYLIYVQRKELPQEHIPSPGFALLTMIPGLAALIAQAAVRLGHNDYLTLMTLSFICFLVAGGFLFLGRRWMAAIAFPIAFLIFMIPLPDRVVDLLETGSKLASTEAANLFFNMTGTPILRDGPIFQLPGIVIEVAQQCSGIRSSLVLFITSLLASHLFLKSPWRRALLVAAVIPLGILRNGFRILVIGLLSIHVGPQILHSLIHRRGGPLFFAISLVPLFLLLWWLRKGEAAPRSGSEDTGAAGVH